MRVLLLMLFCVVALFGQADDWSDITINYPDSLDDTTSFGYWRTNSQLSASQFNKYLRAIRLLQKDATPVPDTTTLKTYSGSGDGAALYLEKLSSTNSNGGGFFVQIDSAYAEGVVAFDNAAAAKQWVRTDFLDKREVNVLWGGADGSDANDDTDAIQNALNLNYNIFIPAGIYLVSNVTTTRRGQTIQGEGRSRLTNLGSVLAPAGDGDTLLTLDGGLEMAVKDMAFSGRYSTNWAKVGIYMEDATSRHRVENCYFEEFDRNFLGESDTSFAILNNSVFSMVLEDNVFFKCDISIYAKNSVQVSQFINNKLTQIYMIGLWLHQGTDNTWLGGTLEAGTTYSNFRCLVKLDDVGAFSMDGFYTEIGNTAAADTSVISAIEITNPANRVNGTRLTLRNGRLGGGSAISVINHPTMAIRAEECYGWTTIYMQGVQIWEPSRFITYSGNRRNVITTIQDCIHYDFASSHTYIPFFTSNKDVEVYANSSFAGDVPWMAEKNTFYRPLVIDGGDKLKKLPKAHLNLYSDLDGEIVTAKANTQSVYLDGSDTLYFADNALADAGRGNFTWSLWFKTEDAKTLYPVGAPRLYMDYLNSTNSLSLWYWANVGGVSCVPYTFVEQNDVTWASYINNDILNRGWWTNPQDNVWHHAVFVRDSTIDSMIVYVDGDENSKFFLPDSNLTWSANTYIGWNFSGEIDDVALWDEALTASHVDTLWNGGKPVDLQTYPADVTADLNLWWDMETINEGAAKDTIYDLVNNIALLSGFAKTTSKVTKSPDSPVNNAMIRVSSSSDDKTGNFVVERDGALTLQGILFDTSGISDDYVWKYDSVNTKFFMSDDSGGSGSGPFSADSIHGALIDTSGIFTNAILKFDGTDWAMASDATGAGGSAYADSIVHDGRHVTGDSLITDDEGDARYLGISTESVDVDTTGTKIAAALDARLEHSETAADVDTTGTEIAAALADRAELAAIRVEIKDSVATHDSFGEIAGFITAGQYTAGSIDSADILNNGIHNDDLQNPNFGLDGTGLSSVNVNLGESETALNIDINELTNVTLAQGSDTIMIIDATDDNIRKAVFPSVGGGDMNAADFADSLTNQFKLTVSGTPGTGDSLMFIEGGVRKMADINDMPAGSAPDSTWDTGTITILTVDSLLAENNNTIGLALNDSFNVSNGSVIGFADITDLDSLETDSLVVNTYLDLPGNSVTDAMIPNTITATTYLPHEAFDDSLLNNYQTGAESNSPATGDTLLAVIAGALTRIDIGNLPGIGGDSTFKRLEIDTLAALNNDYIHLEDTLGGIASIEADSFIVDDLADFKLGDGIPISDTVATKEEFDDSLRNNFLTGASSGSPASGDTLLAQIGGVITRIDVGDLPTGSGMAAADFADSLRNSFLTDPAEATPASGDSILVIVGGVVSVSDVGDLPAGSEVDPLFEDSLDVHLALDETITGNWVNTTSPWANDEVADLAISKTTGLQDSLNNKPTFAQMRVEIDDSTNLVQDVDTTGTEIAAALDARIENAELSGLEAGDVDTTGTKIAAALDARLEHSETAADVDTTGTEIAAALGDRVENVVGATHFLKESFDDSLTNQFKVTVSGTPGTGDSLMFIEAGVLKMADINDMPGGGEASDVDTTGTKIAAALDARLEHSETAADVDTTGTEIAAALGDRVENVVGATHLLKESFDDSLRNVIIKAPDSGSPASGDSLIATIAGVLTRIDISDLPAGSGMAAADFGDSLRNAFLTDPDEATPAAGDTFLVIVGGVVSKADVGDLPSGGADSTFKRLQIDTLAALTGDYIHLEDTLGGIASIESDSFIVDDMTDYSLGPGVNMKDSILIIIDDSTDLVQDVDTTGTEIAAALDARIENSEISGLESGDVDTTGTKIAAALDARLEHSETAADADTTGTEVSTALAARVENAELATVVPANQILDTLTFNWGVMDTVIVQDLPGYKVPFAITLIEIAGYTDAATVTFNIEERAEATPNTTGTNALTADLVADTDQQETQTFSDANFAKDTWITPDISACGDVAVFSITVRYVKQ